MEKNLYYFKNVYFYPEPQDDEMKITKVKNGFKVYEVEAKEIIKKIEAKESFLVTLNEGAQPCSYGIHYYSEPYENFIFKEKKEKEYQDRRVYEAKVLEDAKEWYETLPENEQEMIRILGIYKFTTIALG
jgi:hypothetical protein